jgi:hypothetical protein
MIDYLQHKLVHSHKHRAELDKCINGMSSTGVFETVDDADEDSVNLEQDFSPDQQARLDQLQHEQAQ